MPFSRIVNKVKALYPDIAINVGPGDLGYDNLGALSMERVFQDFGWRPKYSIEEGIEKYNQWLKNNTN